jgi:hypothetical protein
MCSSKPAPPPAPAPAPVVNNPSQMGMEDAPELKTADVVEDAELKKKLSKKKGTAALQTGLNIPVSGGGITP